MLRFHWELDSLTQECAQTQIDWRPKWAKHGHAQTMERPRVIVERSGAVQSCLV